MTFSNFIWIQNVQSNLKICPKSSRKLTKAIEQTLNILVNSVAKSSVDQENPQTQAPPLLIKENQLNETEVYFPNAYHILQCLTTKKANDNFDLERYEILGDCFLKFMVVMKIYSMFPNTNEGNMAELKSQRVSNKYLFKLAKKKRLNEFINTK